MKKFNLIIIVTVMFILSGCVTNQPTVEKEAVEETKTLTFDLTDDWERFPNDPFTAMYGEYVEYGFGVPITKISLKNKGPGTEEDAKKQNSEKLQYYLDDLGVIESSSGKIIVEDVNVYYFNYFDVNFDIWASQIYFSKEGYLYMISLSDKVENHKKTIETIVSTLKLE